ncbi:MAG: MBOAT family protein [Lachnospiraceae bacterium]|nr:MBOAT family protein [Lachnospiraceae bacterium]
MVFSSLTFLFAFLPVSLLLYYVVPGKWKDVVLFAVSLLFYAWGEPVYVFLMLYSIILNYRMGLAMERYPERKKQTMIFAVVLNLAMLGFFKYYGFVVENLNRILPFTIPERELPLPIGISFYTFQALSYILDLYWGRIRCQYNFVRFGAYITMFPQLIAGPIVRYNDIEEELDHRKLSLSQAGQGAQIFLFGMGKKVLLANTIGSLHDTLAAMGNLSTGAAWLSAIAYTLQIYFDFSGYSEMAIGLGKMLGFTFPKNFDYPYASTSVTEFWRRWHISLGTWFREYVYIPLGGNRVSVKRHIANIMIVWLLTGFWHGASWNFALWGVYYGILLLFEKYFLNSQKWIPTWVRWILTLFAVMIGWVIFAANGLSDIGHTLQAMFHGGSTVFWDQTASYYLRTNWVLLAAGVIFSMPFVGRVRGWLMQQHRGVMAAFCVLLFVASLACLITQNYNPFLYFRF